MGGEEEGRVARKRDRDGDTGAGGRTSEAGGVETADQVEEGALESKEEGWGANSVNSEEVESAGWETTGEKNDLMKVWSDEVAGCFFFLCCFGLGGREGGRERRGLREKRNRTTPQERGRRRRRRRGGRRRRRRRRRRRERRRRESRKEGRRRGAAQR